MGKKKSKEKKKNKQRRGNGLWKIALMEKKKKSFSQACTIPPWHTY